jgi:hypothetical protein
MSIDKKRASSLLALSCLIILPLTATIAGSGSGAVQQNSVESHDLRSGTFTLASVDGELSGTYTGQVSVSPSGHTSASVSLNVTSGTQLFQGATGSIAGSGTGAFAGAGTFSISFRGSVSTDADPSGFAVRGKISGTSAISCVNQEIAITLDGDGSLGKLGDAHAVLTHVVANAGCGP